MALSALWPKFGNPFNVLTGPVRAQKLRQLYGPTVERCVKFLAIAHRLRHQKTKPRVWDTRLVVSGINIHWAVAVW